MPLKKKKKDIKIRPVLAAYFAESLKYPLTLVVIIGSTTMLQAAAVIAPLFFKEFIDSVAIANPSEAVVHGLLLILAGYSAVMFAGWVARRFQMSSIQHLEASAMARLSNQAFNYLLGHGHDFFINNFAGSLTRKVSRYARSFEPVFDSVMLNFFPTALYIAGVVTVLSFQNIWLSLGLLVWTIFFIWIQYMMTQWRYQYKIERAAADSEVTGMLSDSVGNHTTVSLFAAEHYERTLFARVIEKWRAATQRSWDADVLNYAIQGLITLVVEIGLLVGAVFLWERGLITIGDFVLIQIYIISLIERVWGIGSTLRRLYDSFADAYEMVEVLELPHTIQDVPNAKTLSVTEGEISFKGVSFTFTEQMTVLKDFNLSIQGGEKVALVGPSGAGKTTITKLLLRLHDVSGGSIQIDEQDIREVSQESLRSSIAFVPQESVLFHRTLRENIAYGKPDASLEEIIEASKKAHCHEFISRLPEGYETYVGERGIKLSGGERQRVAIARAILKDAPILVLDEATSSLDSESEALIQDALKTLMKGKTAIVIAHRLSTIMTMDRIVVLQGGQIAAEGTHAELLAKEGLYQKLWNIQAGGFSTEIEE